MTTGRPRRAWRDRSIVAGKAEKNQARLALVGSRQFVCSSWRHGRTRGEPGNYPGPSRDVSSQALNGFLTGFGRQRAGGARVEPQLAKSGGYDPTFT